MSSRAGQVVEVAELREVASADIDALVDVLRDCVCCWCTGAHGVRAWARR